MLEVRNLFKALNGNEILKNINLRFETGVYGLLGANGAGKTTLIKCLCNLYEIDSGSILYNGIQINHLKNNYFNSLGYLLKELGLYEKKNIRLKLYSGGMLRRVGIAQALLNEPEILILDEPTAGLDPKERIHLKNLLNQYGEKHTVIISTHIVSDVEDISKAIILLKKGEICEQGDLDVLLKKIEGFVYEGTVPKTQLDYFMNKYRVRNVYDLGNTIRIRIITEDNVEKCFVPIEATLNDLYLYYFDEVSEDD